MDLKAALFRKQQECHKEKGGQGGREQERLGQGGWGHSQARWVGLQGGAIARQGEGRLGGQGGGEQERLRQGGRGCRVGL